MNSFFLQVKEAYDKDVKSTIAFVKIDCKSCENICAGQNISNLMQLKYFAKDNFEYKPMFDYITSKVNESLEMHAAEEAAKVKLQDGRSFVKFYSPICPACKGLLA